MKVIDLCDIPKREINDEKRIKEIAEFESTGAEACEVKRFAKDAATDYNRYKNMLWRMGLHEEMKVFTRQGRVFIKRKVQEE